MRWEELTYHSDFVDRCNSLGFEVEFDPEEKLLKLRDETGSFRFIYSRADKVYKMVMDNPDVLTKVLVRIFSFDEIEE